MIISEHIFELLRKKGISLEELSDRTGILQSTIYNWQVKKAVPTADELKIICDDLHVTLQELMGGTDSGGNQVGYVSVDRERFECDEAVVLSEKDVLAKGQRKRLLRYLNALNDTGAEK